MTVKRRNKEWYAQIGSLLSLIELGLSLKHWKIFLCVIHVKHLCWYKGVRVETYSIEKNKFKSGKKPIPAVPVEVHDQALAALNALEVKALWIQGDWSWWTFRRSKCFPRPFIVHHCVAEPVETRNTMYSDIIEETILHFRAVMLLSLQYCSRYMKRQQHKHKLELNVVAYMAFHPIV